MHSNGTFSTNVHTVMGILREFGNVYQKNIERCPSNILYIQHNKSVDIVSWFSQEEYHLIENCIP